MTKEQKAILMHAMMMDNPDYTIRDYLDVVNGRKVFVSKDKAERVPLYPPEKGVFERKVACVAPKIIIEDERQKISTIAVAKKVGFAAGLKPGSVYGTEKAKWAFEIGDKCWALQNAFKASYKEGKQYFQDTMSGNNG